MTSTKAVAGGIGANVVTIILWAVSTIPGWEAVPLEPKAALVALISAGVGAAFVYFAPANRLTLPDTSPSSSAAGGVSFGSSPALAGSN